MGGEACYNGAVINRQDVVYIDTETTGLDPLRHAIWEVALITAEEANTWLVELTPAQIAAADSMALRVGRFEERYLRPRQEKVVRHDNFPSYACSEKVARQVYELTEGKHLVGANPSFDVGFLRPLLESHGFTPGWHYHLIDVEPLMLGVLAERGLGIPIPWKSTDLSTRLGIAAPTANERHTALGDVRWCQRIFESIVFRGINRGL